MRRQRHWQGVSSDTAVSPPPETTKMRTSGGVRYAILCGVDVSRRPAHCVSGRVRTDLDCPACILCPIRRRRGGPHRAPISARPRHRQRWLRLRHTRRASSPVKSNVKLACQSIARSLVDDGRVFTGREVEHDQLRARESPVPYAAIRTTISVSCSTSSSCPMPASLTVNSSSMRSPVVA